MTPTLLSLALAVPVALVACLATGQRLRLPSLPPEAWRALRGVFMVSTIAAYVAFCIWWYNWRFG